MLLLVSVVFFRKSLLKIYETLINDDKISLEAELFSLDGKQRFHVKSSKDLKLVLELGIEVGETLKKESNNSYKK